jgi:hypothetical protein
MCMQCMATAMTAGAAATGMRAWIASHTPHWMTPRRLKMTTAAILAVGVLVAGSHVTPNAPATAKAQSGEAVARTQGR